MWTRPPTSLTEAERGLSVLAGVSEDPAATDQGTDVSRRSMLKAAAPIVAFIALEAIGGIGATKSPTPREVQNASGVVFPDPTLCIGCLTCEVICSQEHRNHGLSDIPRIRIFKDDTVKVDNAIQSVAEFKDRGSFHQEPCLQCPTAECLYVCPVDALRVEPRTGARYIDEDRCVTCGRCNAACIFPTSDLAGAVNLLTSDPTPPHLIHNQPGDDSALAPTLPPLAVVAAASVLFSGRVCPERRRLPNADNPFKRCSPAGVLPFTYLTSSLVLKLPNGNWQSPGGI